MCLVTMLQLVHLPNIEWHLIWQWGWLEPFRAITLSLLLFVIVPLMVQIPLLRTREAATRLTLI